VGSLLAGSKVPATLGSRVVYVDGVPVASIVAGKFATLAALDPSQEQQARFALTRDPRAPRAMSSTAVAGAAAG
jgi:ATP-dependent Lhr-like helicase